MRLPRFSRKIKLSDNERLAILESLSIMLSAGIPILEALDSIKEDLPTKRAKIVVDGLSQAISGGKSLVEGMESYPEVFDSVLRNIVRSGELSGKLDTVLSQVADDLKASIDTANNIKSALFYPALVIVVMVAVGFYAFSFALPKVAEVFLDLNIDLPVYSQAILKFSLFFAKYRYLLIAAAVVFLLTFLKISQIPRVKTAVFLTLVKIPVIGLLIRFMDLFRFTATTSLLLKAGVPIIQVLEISQDVVFTPNLKSDIKFVKDELAKGSTLAEGMKKRPASFPSLLRRVVAVGEDTGTLDTSLANISLHYQKKFTDIVKNLSVFLEPIIIILIAILVGAMLISIIVPIYQGIGQLTPRQGL